MQLALAESASDATPEAGETAYLGYLIAYFEEAGKRLPPAFPALTAAEATEEPTAAAAEEYLIKKQQKLELVLALALVLVVLALVLVLVLVLDPGACGRG